MIRTLKSIFAFISIAFSFALSAQDDANPVLLKVADREVNVKEFEAVFKKNNQEVTKEGLEEYLDLYVNFRLKVQDAKDQGLDTLERFEKELTGYRRQLAAPYLSDNEVTEALIKEAYDRMKVEIRASHIMIMVGANDPPADTIAAYKKIESIKKRLKNGEDFTELAKKLSEDPSAKQNNGDLGYFSAMFMVYPFESMAYNTEVGKVSEIVRTQFGYHLILVTDKRENRGTMTAAHIMTRAPQSAPEPEIEIARQKINEIYDKLEAGESFEDLAMQFSEDKGSSNNGGKLPPFGSGKMVPEFEAAAFALANDGDYSKPIKTQYGFHIVKRISLKTIGTYEDEYPSLKQRIARDKRSTLSKKSFLKKVKNEYGYEENEKTVKDFYVALDTSFFQGAWTVDRLSESMNKTMFTLGDSTATQKDFGKYLEKNQPRRKINNMSLYVDRMYTRFKDEYCIAYEDARLESKYPEFKALVQEYHDGILLFDLTDKNVWSKAVKDTAGLEAYYEKHKKEHMWGQRVEGAVYSSVDEETSKNVRKWLKAKKKKGYSDEDILKMANDTSQLKLTIERGKFSKGDNEFVDKVSWEKGISDDLKSNDRIVFVEIEDVLSEQPKELNEVRGIMTSGYQNELEAAWIEELKGKYKVEVHKEHLSLIK